MLRDPRFWLGAVVAFVIGLGLGLGLYAWRVDAVTAKADKRADEAEKRLAEFEASRGELEERLISAEASSVELEAELTKVGEDDESSGAAQQEQQPSGPAPRIVSRSVSPELVAPADQLKLTVKVKGDAEKVRMRVVSRDASLGFDKSWYLSAGSSSGSSSTWTRTVKAPGDPGEYRYYATAWGGGKRVEMAGISDWTFVVELP